MSNNPRAVGRHSPPHITQKWGFGLAPEKPDIRARRCRAADHILQRLESTSFTDTSADMAAISEIKGLFNRAHRQDQWDWFIVWAQLGRVPSWLAMSIARDLTAWRKAIKEGEHEKAGEIAGELRSAGIARFIQCYLEGRTDWKGGVIYILSTRSSPELLKIGYTTRDPVRRASEINSATGVLEPFGVRAAWSVKEAAITEGEIHALLSEWRVRQDREFFAMDYRDAFKIIATHIRGKN